MHPYNISSNKTRGCKIYPYNVKVSMEQNITSCKKSSRVIEKRNLWQIRANLSYPSKGQNSSFCKKLR